VPLTPTGFAASSPRRRGGGRRRLAVVGVVVFVLLASAAGVGYVLKSRADERRQDERAGQAARAYLAAWTTLTIPAGDDADPRSAPAASPGGGPAVSGPAGSPSAASGAGGPGAGTGPSGAPAQPPRGDGALAGAAELAAVTAAGDVGVADLITMMAQARDRLDVSAAVYTAGALNRSGDTATMPYTAKLTLTGLSPAFSYTGELHLAPAGDAWKVSARLASLHPALKPGLRLARTAPDAVRGRLLDADGRSLADDAELAGNLVGQVEPASGLQRVYDDRLTPSGGEIVVSDAAGKTVETLRTYPSADGKDVRTTIDLDVQRAGEAAMAGAPKPNGALVAVDTRTGGVLALVNHPLNGYGRTIRGSYPPGSTFKIVTATAALMSGKTADTMVDCSPTITVGGRTFQNAENEQLGVIPFRTVFAKSCNTAFIRLEQSLPDDAVAKAAALYGFDGAQPLPIASTGGNYPTPRDDVEHASAAIGQGRVSASPMHMASVAAAVASGAWRQPFVTGQPARSTELPKAALPVLRDMMRAVVTEGTAKDVPFPGEVRGKTGTAEYAEGDPPPTHGWFVGYGGDVAFAVVVEDGGFGAKSAAPVAARFLAGLGGL
jgi:hypothetical protein